ncbi:uncharacterized protein LOC132653239 [Meriones unguiculatus]|uniref:uncharacterized protein LOC132653239 n=1 Tax=Meriones unguiculatus TaxID=10047 RepID=UPI00293F3CBA|nr:uncharacterized protein LOC132653239 [Meriones unguiculatus]
MSSVVPVRIKDHPGQRSYFSASHPTHCLGVKGCVRASQAAGGLGDRVQSRKPEVGAGSGERGACRLCCPRSVRRTTGRGSSVSLGATPRERPSTRISSPAATHPCAATAAATAAADPGVGEETGPSARQDVVTSSADARNGTTANRRRPLPPPTRMAPCTHRKRPSSPSWLLLVTHDPEAEGGAASGAALGCSSSRPAQAAPAVGRLWGCTRRWVSLLLPVGGPDYLQASPSGRAALTLATSTSAARHLFLPVKLGFALSRARPRRVESRWTVILSNGKTSLLTYSGLRKPNSQIG